MSVKPKLPEISGFNCDEKEEFPLAKYHLRAILCKNQIKKTKWEMKNFDLPT